MVSKQCREAPRPGVIDKAAFLGRGSEMCCVVPVSAGALLKGSSFLLLLLSRILSRFSSQIAVVLAGPVRSVVRRCHGALADLRPRYPGDRSVGPWHPPRGASVAARLMTALLARHTLHRHTGLRMFQAVIVFRAATAVFALLHWVWLSVLALALLARRNRQRGDPFHAGCNYPRRMKCTDASAS